MQVVLITPICNTHIKGHAAKLAFVGLLFLKCNTHIDIMPKPHVGHDMWFSHISEFWIGKTCRYILHTQLIKYWTFQDPHEGIAQLAKKLMKNLGMLVGIHST